MLTGAQEINSLKLSESNCCHNLTVSAQLLEKLTCPKVMLSPLEKLQLSIS